MFSRVCAAAALVAATASCGNVVRDGRAPVILVVDTLLGVRGAVSAAAAASPLTSDVLTIVTSGGTCTTAAPCPTIFNDLGQAKSEMPLAPLVTSGQVITAIADVTIYGQDVVGNAVSTTASITINFANFGD